MLFSIFFFLILLLYVLLLLIYRSAWSHLKIFQHELQAVENKIWISVIIPARNEADNIIHCLQSLSKQSLPTSYFEIIIVDDHSEDHTADLVSHFESPNLRLIKMSDFPATSNSSAPKKIAIEKGIAHSSGKWIVTTDADCVFHENWLSTLLSFYLQKNPDCVVMPVSIEPVSNGLSRFEALDFMTLQAVTAAAVSSQQLNMCNGANLSYTKEIFYTVKGFEGIDHVASGDDMLLMEKINKAKGKIEYMLSPEVIVKTKPTENLESFFHQRRRWAGKSASYHDAKMKLILLLVYLLNVCFLFGAMLVLIHPHAIISTSFDISLASMYFSFLVIKFLIEWIFLLPVAAFYGKKHLTLELLFFQPFHIIYIVSTGFLGMLGKYEWKGRRLR